MESKIIYYKTKVGNQGRATLSIKTESNLEKTISFEKQDMGNYAAVCAMLNHPIVEFEMVGDLPVFRSRKS